MLTLEAVSWESGPVTLVLGLVLKVVAFALSLRVVSLALVAVLGLVLKTRIMSLETEFNQPTAFPIMILCFSRV